MKYLTLMCLAACAQPTPVEAIAGTFPSGLFGLEGTAQGTAEITGSRADTWTLASIAGSDTEAGFRGPVDLTYGGVTTPSSQPCLFHVNVNQDRTFLENPLVKSECAFNITSDCTWVMTLSTIHGAETDDGELLAFGLSGLTSSCSDTPIGLVSFSFIGDKATP